MLMNQLESDGAGLPRCSIERRPIQAEPTPIGEVPTVSVPAAMELGTDHLRDRNK
jgi:hypothetical protein